MTSSGNDETILNEPIQQVTNQDVPKLSDKDAEAMNTCLEDEEILRICNDFEIDGRVARAKSETKKCFFCNQKFEKQALAKSHMERTKGKCCLVTNIISEGGVWKCQIGGCEKILNRGNNMRRHYKDKHTPE